MDDGRLWNFEAQQCTAMRKASFDCNFDAFFQKLRDIGITPSTLLEDSKSGRRGKATIVGCGESASRDTLFIQWVLAPLEPLSNCASSPIIKVITGCYGKDSGTFTGNHDDQRNAVLNCMNGVKAP